MAADQVTVTPSSHQTIPVDEWQLRLFNTIEEEKLPFTLKIPAKPEWGYSLEKRPNTTAIIVRTPELQVPPLGMDIFILENQSIQKENLRINALTATQSIAKQVNYKKTIALSDLQYTTYGKNIGYTYEFQSNYDGIEYDFLIFNGILGKHFPLSVTATTSAGDMDKNTYYINKIISNIAEK